MQFVVHALDHDDALPRRLGVIDAHRAFLGEAPSDYGVNILLSGPLVDDNGTDMKGRNIKVNQAKPRAERPSRGP